MEITTKSGILVEPYELYFCDIYANEHTEIIKSGYFTSEEIYELLSNDADIEIVHKARV